MTESIVSDERGRLCRGRVEPPRTDGWEREDGKEKMHTDSHVYGVS